MIDRLAPAHPLGIAPERQLDLRRFRGHTDARKQLAARQRRTSQTGRHQRRGARDELPRFGHDPYAGRSVDGGLGTRCRGDRGLGVRVGPARQDEDPEGREPDEQRPPCAGTEAGTFGRDTRRRGL